MKAKIIHLHVDDWPAQFADVSGYDKAYIVVWYQQRVVGQVWLNVINGRINLLELQDKVLHPRQWSLWQRVALGQLTQQPPAPPAPLHTPATVAVCTRNRPDDIKRCLAAFMEMHDDGQEFLIVDNCPSTDDTYHVVAEFGDRVRYVREDRPGLNIARNRALREAKHEIVAFNDDDAVPQPDWLRALVQNFTHPDILAVTGLTMPLELETEAQVVFERISPFSRGYERRVHWGNRQNALRAGSVGAGANMALRRSLLTTVGPFDEALDSGMPTKSGGDTEIFARILSQGYHIVYDPAALSWHRHRRTWAELHSTMYGYGVGTYAMWTRMLLLDKNTAVFKAGWQHFWYYQLPNLLKGMIGDREAVPLDLMTAELRGCWRGAGAYLQARRLVAPFAREAS